MTTIVENDKPAAPPSGSSFDPGHASRNWMRVSARQQTGLQEVQFGCFGQAAQCVVRPRGYLAQQKKVFQNAHVLVGCGRSQAQCSAVAAVVDQLTGMGSQNACEYGAAPEFQRHDVELLADVLTDFEKSPGIDWDVKALTGHR